MRRRHRSLRCLGEMFSLVGIGQTGCHPVVPFYYYYYFVLDSACHTAIPSTLEFPKFKTKQDGNELMIPHATVSHKYTALS